MKSSSFNFAMAEAEREAASGETVSGGSPESSGDGDVMRRLRIHVEEVRWWWQKQAIFFFFLFFLFFVVLEVYGGERRAK
jgi:hypothetical protein